MVTEPQSAKEALRTEKKKYREETTRGGTKSAMALDQNSEGDVGGLGRYSSGQERERKGWEEVEQL